MFSIFNKKMILFGSMFIYLPLFAMEMNINEKDCVESKSKKRRIDQLIQTLESNYNIFETLPKDVLIENIIAYLIEPAENLQDLKETILKLKATDKYFANLYHDKQFFRVISQKKIKLLISVKNFLDQFDDRIDPQIDIIKNGINARGKNGQTLLHDYPAFKALISAGIDINAKDNNGDTALTIAVNEGNMEKIESLLAYGVDVKIRNNKRETALDIAKRKDWQNNPWASGFQPSVFYDIISILQQHERKQNRDSKNGYNCVIS